MMEGPDKEGIQSVEKNGDTNSADNQPPTSQQLMDRINNLKALPNTTTKSKKQLWSHFLSLWLEVLQTNPSITRSCYDECVRLLPILQKSTGFISLISDPDFARENVFACFTQLNQTHIKEYLTLSNEKRELPDTAIYKKPVYHLVQIASDTVGYFELTNIDDQQFIDNHVDLFIILIEYVEQDMPEHSTKMVEKGYALCSISVEILRLLWDLADQTRLVSKLLKCGLAKRVISWLAQSAILTEKSRKPLISIVHNIARHDDGVDELNKHGAIDVIKQYQKMKTETIDSRILIASMTLALLSLPEQLKQDKKGMNAVLNQLLQLVMDAAKSDDYRYDGFHVSEPLEVLVKIFVVEERTLDYVLCHAETEPISDMPSTVNLFISLLFSFSNALKGSDRLEQFTLVALLNILWSISFQMNYAQELAKNEKLIENIQKLIENEKHQDILEQYKPRSMESIKQATIGILHNLNRNSKNDVKSDGQISFINTSEPNSAEHVKKKTLLMISYSHNNNTFCSQILSLLAKHNDMFDIWIDRTHCQGANDLWEMIASGMESASIIICLLSSQYFESKSCRQEFIYANDSLKKNIVYVLLDNFEPRGWLGIRMTGMKYVRFRNTYQPEESKMVEFLNTILATASSSELLISDKLSSLSHHQPTSQSVSITIKPNAAPFRPIDQWTSTNGDIHAWFASNQIPIELDDLFNFQTGDEMLDYAQLLVEDRRQQMTIYTKIYSDKYHGRQMPPHEFNRFAKALELLLRENRQSTYNASSNASVTIKSGACILI